MKSRLAPLALAMLAPLAAWSQVSVFINVGPPLLPYYAQPAVPGEGYIWTPGYWSWSRSDNDYYWVPGTWVLAPAAGYLWTPGYWGFEGGGYLWHLGYWAERVGFYGGLDYGYGYTGSGYQGGRWDRGVFRYNRSVSNVDTSVVHNFYNAAAVNNHKVTRASFNGGPGGVAARPGAAELRVQAARHIGPTPNQVQHEHTALTTPTQRASVNHGAPQVAATPRPTAFAAPGVSHARNETTAARPAPAAALQPPPTAAPRPVPPPPHAEARLLPQPQTVHEQPAARGGEQRAAHVPPAVPHVQPAPPAERPVQARPEAAPHPQPQSHPQPQRPHPQPQPRAEHEQPEGQAEPHRQEPPRKEH